jgi:hypothetical protein
LEDTKVEGQDLKLRSSKMDNLGGGKPKMGNSKARDSKIKHSRAGKLKTSTSKGRYRRTRGSLSGRNHGWSDDWSDA